MTENPLKYFYSEENEANKRFTNTKDYKYKTVTPSVKIATRI